MSPLLRLLLPALLAVLALALASPALAQPAPSAEPRIVAGVNVRLRSGPSLDSSVVMHLPLGAALSVNLLTPPRDTSWLYVSAMFEGTVADGYVHADLTRRVSIVGGRAMKWQTVEALARERLARRNDDITWRVEVFDMLTRERQMLDLWIQTRRRDQGDQETLARLTLLWIQSLRTVAASLPREAKVDPLDPIHNWLAQNDSLIVLDDVTGRWIPRTYLLWALHDQHLESLAADDIAWAIRGIGTTTDCQEFVLCHLGVLDKRDMEYLRRHPRGAHASEAVRHLGSLLERLMKPLAVPFNSGWLPKEDCPQVLRVAESLERIVRSTHSPEAPATIAAIDKLQKGCGGLGVG